MVVKVHCSVHGSQLVPKIGLLGPTFTRPELRVIPRLDWDQSLYGGDATCDHYITYAPGGGVWCIRCRGWFCA